MAIDPAAPRSRRAILAGAIGGAGALAAHALSQATPVSAANDAPVLLGQGTTATDNAATLPTIVNSSADPGFGAVASAEAATALEGTSASGIGVLGVSNGPIDPSTGRSAGVVGLGGGAIDPERNVDETGVYGAADVSGSSAGVWGDSPQGVGVVGTGDWGIYGFGVNEGSISVIGDSVASGTGVYGFSGDDDLSLPTTAGAGLVGRAGVGGHYGVVAAAAAPSAFALYVAGRLRVSPGAGGRTSFTSAATSKKITLAGVNAGTLIVATLQTNISGCYVRAVVPTTGAFTIYLSKAPGKTAVVGYMIAN